MFTLNYLHVHASLGILQLYCCKCYVEWGKNIWKKKTKYHLLYFFAKLELQQLNRCSLSKCTNQHVFKVTNQTMNELLPGFKVKDAIGFHFYQPFFKEGTEQCRCKTYIILHDITLCYIFVCHMPKICNGYRCCQ